MKDIKEFVQAKQKDKLDHVIVSQASRDMAHKEPVLKFESYSDELKHHINTKLECESLLSQLGSQKKIRVKELRTKFPKNCTEASVQWLKIQNEIEKDREKLVAKKHNAEREIQRLRPLANAEELRSGLTSGDGLEVYKLIRDDGSLSYAGVAAQILTSLKRIEALLEKRQ